MDFQRPFDKESIAEHIKIIENAQHSNSRELDPFTLEELMIRFGIPGLSIAVVNDFKVHWAKAYGSADVKTGAKVDTKTLFQAASISKPVLAMAVLKAVQNGKFSMDDDINTILKSWKLPASPFTKDTFVTPRMLTSHTSGLGDEFGFPGYLPSAPRPTTVQILNGEEPSNVGTLFFDSVPMTTFKYSGGGVTIMQLALADAVGMPIRDIFEDYVLRPIGMINSTFEQPLSPELDRNAARAHNGKGQAIDAKWYVYPELAAAGLWTTPTDLAKFAIEVQKSLRNESNKVLSQTTIKEMLSPVGVGDYAVGFEISKEGQEWYFGHGGGNKGFGCVLRAHKVKGHGVAIMANGGSVDSNGQFIFKELKRRIARVYGWI